MTQYTRRVENYGPNGLINAQDIPFNLTGEDEQRYLSPDRLRTAYATLRQWSLDAAQVDTDWPTLTAAQKDARQQILFRRLAVFFDRFADLLLIEGKT